MGSSVLCPQILTECLARVRCSEYTQLRVWFPVDTPVFNSNQYLLCHCLVGNVGLGGDCEYVGRVSDVYQLSLW